jgi:tetratricopeptide (TPR) repeat protein
LKGATEAYEKVVITKPEQADTWLKLAMLYQHAGSNNRTAEAITRYLELKPSGGAEPYLIRANALRSLNQKEQALSDYSVALQKEPKLAEAWVNRGILHYETGKIDAAIFDLTTTLELDNRFPEALFIRGKSYFDKGVYDSAAVDLGRLSEREPDNFEVAHRYASALLKSKDTIRSLFMYDQLISSHPDELFIYDNRAGIRMARADFSGAYQDYGVMRKRNPELALPIAKQGICKYYDGDAASALELLNQAIQKEPKAEWLMFRALSKQKTNKTEGVLEDLNLAIELEPRYPEPYFHRAIIRYSNKEYGGAMPDFSKAIDLNPDYFEAYFNRADATFLLGDFRASIKDYTKALEIRPNHEEAHFNRGVVRLRMNDYKGAMDDFLRCIELNPGSGRYVCHRGLAKLGLGQKEDGCEDMSKAGHMGYVEAYEYIRKVCSK